MYIFTLTFITKFNTLLLRYGLNNEQILIWTQEYSDSKVYMHTKLLETEYTEIGGPYGLAVQKNISERKVVFFIIMSVLEWLDGGESIEEII